MVAISGCAKSDSSNDNRVTIVSVTPADAVAGVATDFTVEVEYLLDSNSDGLLSVAFNDGDSPTSFTVYADLRQVVEKGEGTHIFTVPGVVPVDWSPDEFQVKVYLSENPPPTLWRPYATVVSVIPVTAPDTSDTLTATGVSASPVTCYLDEANTTYCIEF